MRNSNNILDARTEIEADHEHYNSQGLIEFSRVAMKADGFHRKGQSWFVELDLESDLTLEINGWSFHLHKFPLLSRSGRLNQLLVFSESAGKDYIKLDDIPGGEKAFELVAKFCYGASVDLTATNVAALRCAAEYLEMTEDLEEGNLISKTEIFLGVAVSSSWKDSILVLKSCEQLSPWAENLQLVRRSCDSIAWKACTDPRGINWSYTPAANNKLIDQNTDPPPIWDEIKERHEFYNNKGQSAPQDWWFEDVSMLRIDHFVRVISAIKVKGMKPNLVGAAIMYYSSKWLPGILNLVESSIVTRIEDMSTVSSGLVKFRITGGRRNDNNNKEKRMVIESIISIIPPEKDTVSCSFLLRLLKMANMFNATPALVTELEKKVGMQLEQATLSDLLIPSYDSSESALYDVDLARRILEHFLIQEKYGSNSEPCAYNANEIIYNVQQGYHDEGASHPDAKMLVAKLVDSYLVEVARDPNVSLAKFQGLAESLPENARTCDDGLYRAIDTYLKTHSTLTEHERKRLCRIMDCQKLSVDACLHAAQNERLPVRNVLQVLFCEQIRVRNTLTLTSASNINNHQLQLQSGSPRKSNYHISEQSYNLPTAIAGESLQVEEVKTMKYDLEKVKLQLMELQQDYSHLQREFQKLAAVSKQKSSGSSSSHWISGWKKLSKLKTSSIFQTRNDIDDYAGQMPDESNHMLAHQQNQKSRHWRNSVS